MFKNFRSAIYGVVLTVALVFLVGSAGKLEGAPVVVPGDPRLPYQAQLDAVLSETIGFIAENELSYFEEVLGARFSGEYLNLNLENVQYTVTKGAGSAIWLPNDLTSINLDDSGRAPSELLLGMLTLTNDFAGAPAGSYLLSIETQDIPEDVEFILMNANLISSSNEVVAKFPVRLSVSRGPISIRLTWSLTGQFCVDLHIWFFGKFIEIKHCWAFNFGN